MNELNNKNKDNYILNNIVLTDDLLIYGRNNSSGNPTKIHLYNDKLNKSYCGFDSYTAEIKLIEKGNNVFIKDICKKCKKNNNNTL